VEHVEDIINEWGGRKTQGKDPQLSYFRFSFNRKKTTNGTLVDGWSFYKFDWTPVSINERMTVESSINIGMIGNPLGLATTQEPQVA
jgi:hypothetical protein